MVDAIRARLQRSEDRDAAAKRRERVNAQMAERREGFQSLTPPVRRPAEGEVARVQSRDPGPSMETSFAPEQGTPARPRGLRTFDATTNPELEMGPGGTAERPAPRTRLDDIEATRSVGTPPEQPAGLRDRGGNPRAVQPVIGQNELEEMQRRASIDTRSSMSNPALDTGPRMARGMTRAQRGQLASAGTAGEFLNSRLQATLASRQEDPTQAAAQERGLRRLESDRSFNLGEQEVAAGRADTASRERTGLRGLEQRETESVRDAILRTRERDGDGRGLFPTRQVTDAEGNPIGEELFDFDRYTNMSPEDQARIGGALGKSVAADLRASGIEADEGDVGERMATLVGNTSAEIKELRRTDPQQAASMEQLLLQSRGGIQRLATVSYALQNLNPEIEVATSLPQMARQTMEMVANERNKLFFSGTKSRIGDAKFDMNDVEGVARSQMNQLRSFARDATVQMMESDPALAKRALGTMLESDLAEAREAAREQSRSGSSGVQATSPGMFTGNTGSPGSDTRLAGRQFGARNERADNDPVVQQLKAIQQDLVEGTPESLAWVRDYMQNKGEQEASADMGDIEDQARSLTSGR